MEIWNEPILSETTLTSHQEKIVHVTVLILGKELQTANVCVYLESVREHYKLLLLAG